MTALWIGGGLTFAYIALTAPQSTSKSDALIVLTGGAHRVETAFNLLIDGKAGNLLISGVYEGNTIKDLVMASALLNTDQNKILNHCCITLDFNAHSTAQNATESIKWMIKNDYKSAIIVTSDYHITRSKLHFNRLKPDDINLNYYSVTEKQNIFSYHYWQNIFTEYHKFMVTVLYGLLPSTQQQDKSS
jgi:uncharacterized SAM-binding protein YcdF (DUF218 family)